MPRSEREALLTEIADQLTIRVDLATKELATLTTMRDEAIQTLEAYRQGISPQRMAVMIRWKKWRARKNAEAVA